MQTDLLNSTHPTSQCIFMAPQ